jgi:phosphate transport system permease protein
MVSTSVGVIMLAMLLIDVATDSFGWVGSRIDRDPRMFLRMYEGNPQFAEQAQATDPGLFSKMEAKLKSRERSAERDGRTLSAVDHEEIREDVLQSEYSRDEKYFEQFGMVPTAGDRLAIGWAIFSDFLTAFPSRHPSKAGIKSAIVGSIWLLALTALFAIPIGISAAVYLEEFAAKNRLNRFVEVNIANLAGVPSIVYGILGLAVFVRGADLGRSVLAGAATMSLLILPVIIIAAREALKAVPDSLRASAFALGGTRWQVTQHHVLPAALPGILTGVILAMSRAIGETAPMIMIGALSYVAFVPQGPMDDFTVLPIQIFNWIAMPQEEFHMLGACGILVLLTILLLMNATAIFIRHRAQKELRW